MKRAFYYSTKAWYAKKLNAENEKIIFGIYEQGEGTTGEMKMQWVTLGTRQVPQLCIFDDAWNALTSFPDVIQKLGEVDSKNITPDQFIEILLSCGFTDNTEYNNPHEPNEQERINLKKKLIEAKIM